MEAGTKVLILFSLKILTEDVYAYTLGKYEVSNSNTFYSVIFCIWGVLKINIEICWFRNYIVLLHPNLKAEKNKFALSHISW